jgi:integrase
MARSEPARRARLSVVKDASKRANGQGSVWERSSGVFVLRYADAEGTRRSVTEHCRNRREAERKLEAILERVAVQRDARAAGDLNSTLSSWIDRWLDMRALGGKKSKIPDETTVRRYTQLLAHPRQELGHLRMRQLLDPAVLKKYYERLRSEPRVRKRRNGALVVVPISPRERHHIHVRLRELFNDAELEGVIPAPYRSPYHRASPPVMEKPDNEPEALTKRELRAILACVKGDPVEAFIRFQAFSGCRPQEARALSVEKALHLRTAVLIDEAMKSSGIKGGTKTEKPREIPKIPQLLEAIDMALQQVAVKRGRAGDEWVDCGLLFPSASGEYQSNSGLLKRFRLCQIRAGLVDDDGHHLCDFVKLRRTYRTLIKGKVADEMASRILGHTEEVDREFYVAHTDEGFDDAAAAIAQVFLDVA